MGIADRLFDAFFHPWMRSRLSIHLAGLPTELDDQPLVYCANHESWWDGFLVRHLHQRLRPSAPFHAVMLDGELRARPLLRSIGALGIEAGSVASGRRLLRSLRSVSRSAGIAFFPQGRIRPGAHRPLRFRGGVYNVVRAMAPATLLPVAIRLLPGRSHRMNAFVSLGPPVSVSEGRLPSARGIEAAVAAELDAVEAFVRRFEEDAADVWPTPSGCLPRSVERRWPVGVSNDFFSRN